MQLILTTMCTVNNFHTSHLNNFHIRLHFLCMFCSVWYPSQSKNKALARTIHSFAQSISQRLSELITNPCLLSDFKHQQNLRTLLFLEFSLPNVSKNNCKHRFYHCTQVNIQTAFIATLCQQQTAFKSFICGICWYRKQQFF